MRLLPGIAVLFTALLAIPFAECQPQNAALQLPQVTGLPSAASAAAASIDPAKISAHVRFLSLDLLEGRGPGTRGDSLAAEYIATQFALAGLQPAGDNGTYFQRVPLYAVHTDEEKTTFAFEPANGPAVNLAYGTQIVSKDQTGQATADFDAPIVFVGYGIDAPEYKWNDYEGVDLKGKIALAIVNEPPSDDIKFFNGKALTYYGRWTYKYEIASEKGAAAAIVIHETGPAGYPYSVVQSSNSLEQFDVVSPDAEKRVPVEGWIRLEKAKELLANAHLNFDSLKAAAVTKEFKPVPLAGAKASFDVKIDVRKIQSHNVVAKVEGLHTHRSCPSRIPMNCQRA